LIKQSLAEFVKVNWPESRAILPEKTGENRAGGASFGND
jgi:hypothetical protein